MSQLVPHSRHSQIATKLNRLRFHPKGSPVEHLALINHLEEMRLRRGGGRGLMTKFGVRSFAPDGGDDGNGGMGYGSDGSPNNRSGYSSGSSDSATSTGRGTSAASSASRSAGDGHTSQGYGGNTGGAQGGGGQNTGGGYNPGNRPDGGNDGNSGYGYSDAAFGQRNTAGNGYTGNTGSSSGGGLLSGLGSKISDAASAFGNGLVSGIESWGNLISPAPVSVKQFTDRVPMAPDKDQSQITPTEPTPVVKDQSRIGDAITQSLINNYAAYKNPNAGVDSISPSVTRTVGSPTTGADSSSGMEGGAPNIGMDENEQNAALTVAAPNPYGVDTSFTNVAPGASYVSYNGAEAPSGGIAAPRSQTDPSSEDVPATPNYNTTYDALASILGQIPTLAAARTAKPSQVASIAPQNYGFSAPPANTQVAMATPAQDAPSPFTAAQIAAAQVGGAGFAPDGNINPINPNGVIGSRMPLATRIANYIANRPYNPRTAGTMDSSLNGPQGQGYGGNRFLRPRFGTPPTSPMPGQGENNPWNGNSGNVGSGTGGTGTTAPPTGTTVQGPMGPAYSYATALGNYVIDIATGMTFKLDPTTHSYVPVAAAA